MTELVLTTYDWVPEPARGLVRDLRVRWALEEAGLPYRVASTPFQTRDAEHLAHQPFGQVPWLTHGDLSIFESGAILLHLGELSEKLLPPEGPARWKAVAWAFAALNSLEMAVLPRIMLHFAQEPRESTAMARFDAFVKLRLDRLEPVLAEGEWLAGAFSIADIQMADVLRLADRFDGLAGHPACAAYLAKATARPAFHKALADQLAHFAAAD